MSEKAFTAGEAEQVGDCGKWAAYIDDQSHKSPLRSAWYARIRVLGNTERQADELRSIILDALNAKPEAVAWNGEGKPPAGAVCEVWHKAPHKEWAHHVGKQATIVCHDGPRAVYRVESEQGVQYHGLGGGADGKSWPFRPLRTAEQIAAEEREAKAKAMYLSVYFLESAQGWDRIPEATRETFRKAIDAGWQQVKP